MSDSDAAGSESRNALYRLAATGGVLLGLLLLAGAFGHLAAVWSALDNAVKPTPGDRLTLLLPGMILLVTGVVNLALCWALWARKTWALHTALACNVAAATYFGWLLMRGVPEHPIGLFLAVACSDVLLLGAIRAGLEWPAASTR